MKQCKQCSYVIFTDSMAAETFLFSGALEKRRAVEAFTPHQEDEDMVQCNTKSWHVKEWERVAYYMRCYLEKPIMLIDVHPKDVPRLDLVLRQIGGGVK